MLVIALLLVWGGLAASIAYLRARPEVIVGPGAIDPDEYEQDDNRHE